MENTYNIFDYEPKYNFLGLGEDEECAHSIKIKHKTDNLDLSKYEYLEKLEYTYNVDHDIDISNLNKLKTLIINFKENITINLPSNLETLIIIGKYGIENNIKLINYENIKNLYTIDNLNIDIDFSNMNKLEKLELKFSNLINSNSIDLSNSKNLIYLNIDIENIEYINLENCNKLKHININNPDLNKIILPSNVIKLELSNVNSKNVTLEIINLYNNINIKSLSIFFNLKYAIDFSKFKDLETLVIWYNKNFINNYLDISNNFKITNFNLMSCEVSYIDFPYNFDFETNRPYINNNIFSEKKVISRRRVYLLAETPLKGSVVDGLCESKEGTRNGLAETPLKGSVVDGLCENKEGAKNELTELKDPDLDDYCENFEESCEESCEYKCYRCKRNINIHLKLNIRKLTFNDDNGIDQEYNIVSCC